MQRPWRPEHGEPVELRVQLIDESEIWGCLAEHREARLIVAELGAVGSVVESGGRQQRELANLGDLVRREDRERVGVAISDSLAQLPFTLLVVCDRLIAGYRFDELGDSGAKPPAELSLVVGVFSSTSCSNPAAMQHSSRRAAPSSWATSMGCTMNGARSTSRY